MPEVCHDKLKKLYVWYIKMFVFNTLVVKEQNAMKIKFIYKSETELNRGIKKVLN